eukprot:309950-Pleurochrysis_carterae.AAC.1
MQWPWRQANSASVLVNVDARRPGARNQRPEDRRQQITARYCAVTKKAQYYVFQHGPLRQEKSASVLDNVDGRRSGAGDNVCELRAANSNPTSRASACRDLLGGASIRACKPYVCENAGGERGGLIFCVSTWN